MDCNKEEARRAKTLAENKMRNGDFVGAQKLIMKAQKLFSGLESLPRMLAICEVHSSAEKKINGLENWYGILQAMHFNDDATIKKQYKKLALLLHPDKNQFAGAESAFKLIGEAIRFLSDKEKRSQYDIKRRIYSRVVSEQLNANSGQQRAAANNASDDIINIGTFWTCCEHCGYRYKYLGKHVNTNLYCPSCQRSFMAYDTGFNGVPPKSSTGQKEVRNQGPCNTSLHKHEETTGAQPGNAAVEVDKKETVKEKPNKKSGGGENKNAEVRKPKVEDGFVKNSKPEKGEGKMKNNSELPKVDVLKPQPEVTEPKTGASESVPDESVSRSDKKTAEEPIDVAERTTKKKSKHLDFCGSCASSRVIKGKAKKNVDSGYQEISSTKDKENKGCKASGEGVVMAGKIDIDHKANEKPIITQDSPDPDFNDFEPTTNCFAVNQVWSLYDPTDGMPRFYARINKVLDSEFKLWITWLDPLQDDNDNSIPIACGIFQDGESEEVDDHLMFSCQMLHLPQDNNIVIYPRKGEIWAIFRGWNISWSCSSENHHKRPYEYDYVEVLSDFKDEDGLGVAYLGKVEGFVSLFRQVSLFPQDAQHGVLQLQIPPSEMLRFSHKVPSFKMTGKEREGIPPGCFELDTAALPKDMFEDDSSKVDVELDRQKLNGKTGGDFPEASEVDVQAKTTLESSPSPKKRQKVRDDHSSFSKASDGKCTNQEMNSLKKSRKSVKAVDDLKLRKSPRRLSEETKNQATSRSSTKPANEKKNANNGESCGQPDEFCISSEKMITPKQPEKVIATDSSRIRKIPKKHDAPLSQSSSTKCSEPETHVPSSCTTGQENTFNFTAQRSADKFQIDQIWAIYSNEKGMPRKYAQIKQIDTSPEFKLHVAPLELYRPPNLMTHTVCCGCFKLKTGKAEVLVPSSFSHQVKAVKRNANRFEVYPGKGEIWALYRNWNNAIDCGETGEVEIVEVVETDEQSIQVVPLTAKGFNKTLYGRSEVESKAGFLDIQKTQVSRFSHQIPAVRHERRATRFGDSEYWELDTKAVPVL